MSCDDRKVEGIAKCMEKIKTDMYAMNIQQEK